MASPDVKAKVVHTNVRAHVLYALSTVKNESFTTYIVHIILS